MPKNYRLISNQLDQSMSHIITRYENGDSYPEIAKALGFNKETVRARLKKSGVILRKRTPALGTEKRIYEASASIVRRYLAGESAGDIARSLNTDSNVIRRVLKTKKIFKKDGLRSLLLVNHMSEVERSWLGAMLDGEGSFIPTGVYLANTELEFISAALRITGVGGVALQRVTGSPVGGTTAYFSNHNQWSWYVNRKHTVKAIAEQIKNYSIKAQKWLEENVT